MKRKLVIAVILVCLVTLGLLAAGPVSLVASGDESGRATELQQGYGYGGYLWK